MTAIPLSLMLRVLTPTHLIAAQTAEWVGGEIVVRFDDGRADLRFAPLTRAQLAARVGEERVGEAACGWSLSDGRLVFERAGGGTTTWVPDARAAQDLAEVVYEHTRRALKAAA